MKLISSILLTFLLGQIIVPNLEVFMDDCSEHLSMEIEEDSKESDENEEGLDECFKPLILDDFHDFTREPLSSSDLFIVITRDYGKVYLGAPYSPPEFV